MQGAVQPPQDSRSWIYWQSPTAWLGWKLFRKTLNERGPALNVARLMTSRHLADLQWIATFAVLPVLGFVLLLALSVPVLAVLGLCELLHGFYHSLFDPVISGCKDCLWLVGRAFGWLKRNSAILGTLLGALLAIFNWSYQAANRRLGTIDLFSAEISTICRGWLVVNFAEAAVARAMQHLPGTGRAVEFSGDERYTPVHDGQLAELVAFDVGVVTTITEFYTYRTTMLDFLRNASTATGAEAQYLTDQMFYMFYLSLEAARLAIGKIVEFEPNEAESVINILCSEIPVFAYLLIAFPPSDYRGKRLRLRLNIYGPIVARLRVRVREHQDHWTKASTTFPELRRRYLAYRRAYPRVRSATGPTVPLKIEPVAGMPDQLLPSTELS